MAHGLPPLAEGGPCSAPQAAEPAEAAHLTPAAAAAALGRLSGRRQRAGWVGSSSHAAYAGLDPPLPARGRVFAACGPANLTPFSSDPDMGSTPLDLGSVPDSSPPPPRPPVRPLLP